LVVHGYRALYPWGKDCGWTERVCVFGLGIFLEEKGHGFFLMLRCQVTGIVTIRGFIFSEFVGYRKDIRLFLWGKKVPKVSR
jgi:hypothetical protein